jgi:hypothetical protein
MAFFKPVQYRNNPDGITSSTAVHKSIQNLIQSYFGQDRAFIITFIKPTANSLDAQVEVYVPDYENETLCLEDTLTASSFAGTREAVVGGKDPANRNYVAGYGYE